MNLDAERAGGLTLSRVQNERGRLARPPIVDEHGYSFVVAGRGGARALELVRRRELQPVGCDDERFVDSSVTRPPPASAQPCAIGLLAKLL